MPITVEFYGIPRQRAGVETATAEGTHLGEVLLDLTAKFPELGESCLDGRQLRPGYVANLNGRQFVSDPETVLQPNDTLLIMSADAGG